MTTLEIDHVHKAYGDVHAVNDLSLRANEGQIFGLLGPNGAGKTTTIRMIMDIIKPDSGSIKVLGEKSSQKIRDWVGYLPEERGLYKKMLVKEVIQFFAEIKGITKNVARERADGWLERLELMDWKEKKVEELSRGMQQKLQLICTVLHEPKIIILDEPFTGLDPSITKKVMDIILDLKNKGVTIIFSTHIMAYAEILCESICLIDKGSAVLQGSLTDIKSQFRKNRVRLQYDGNAAFLADTSLVASYDENDRYVELNLAQDVTPQQILAKAIQEVTVNHFEIAEPSLTDIFIAVVEQGRDV